MEKTYSPFKLSITVHGAENLPIADYTTSDPFVSVYIGERLIGKTKVIKRNHMHPKWNETLPSINLLHTNHELEFKIFDEDVGQDDDLMGTIKIDLKDFPSDGTLVRRNYPMACAPGFKTKSFVDLAIGVYRNDSVISIQSIDPFSFNEERIQKKMDDDYFSKVVIQSIQQDRLWLNSTDVIRSTLTKWLTEDISPSLLSVPFFRDLLLEATILCKDDSEQELLIDVIRNRLKLQNSTKLLLQHDNSITSEAHSYAPLEELSLQINLSSDDAKFVLLTFSNRFMIWSWVKWIRLAYDYWLGAIPKDSLPSWATSFTRSSNASISIYDGRSFTRRIILDLNNPFVLRMGDDSISLRSISSLTISVDSFVPANYSLEIELSDNTLTLFEQHNIEGLDLNFVQRDLGAKKRMSVGNAVVGALSKIKHLGSKGRSLVKHTAVGGFTSTVKAARIIATGDATKVIKGAQDKIIGVTHGIASTVVSAPQSLFGKSLSYVMVRCRDEVYHFPLTETDVHYVDFELNDLYKVPSLIHRAKKEIADQITSTYHLFPIKKQQALLMDFTLYHGVEGQPKVYGQSVQKVKNLIKMTSSSSESNGERKIQHFDIAFGESATFEIPFMKVLGYSVTIVNARNLVVSSSTGSGNVLTKMDIIHRGLFAKVKLVSCEGKSGFKSLTDEFKTPIIKVTPDPVWNHSVTLITGQQIVRECFIRIEFLLEDITTLGEISIGAAFIPLDYGATKEQELTFPVTRFRASTAYVVNNAQQQRGTGFGEVTIRLKRIEEDYDHHKRNYKVEVQTLVKEATLFNTSWYGEILPVSGVDLDSTCVECALVTVLHDGLQLNEQESLPTIEGRSGYSQSVANSEGHETIPYRKREFKMEVFENERRTPYPPFEWSNSAYTRARFSDLTFSKSYKFESLADSAPPDGCDWNDEWTIDTEHAKTDKDGWIYGFTFGMIASNYKKGVTYPSSRSCQARRRKWVRTAMLRDSEVIEEAQIRSSFGQSLSKIHASRSHASSVAQNKDKAGDTSPTASNKWRKALDSNPNYGILATCSEKVGEDAPVMIDWNEILSTTVVTPSVLSITFVVHRYFADVDSFRGAEMEMFVSNCPAAEFKSLLDERIWFHKTRIAVKRLVHSGNIFGTIDPSLKSSGNNNEPGGTISANVTIDDGEEGIPQTEELSLGSETIKDLDDQLIALQQRVDEINALSIHQNHQSGYRLEKSILERRIIRLRLYIAGLFGVSLKGVHTYDDKEIREMMFTDFKRAKAISLDDDVSTANNRIEYLLDMAEMRIRDAALCGWNFRGEKLENCLQVLANGYFIEIVSILGKFFDREDDIEASDAQTKGLMSKVELVNTYMKHNDRLHNIILNALRPYGLEANPPAQLSLFLNFDVLVQWYTSTLITEMRSWVNKVLDTWKDLSKDVTGQNSLYKHPIPWIPDRASSGMFYANIPEDLVEALLNYLTFARINPENVAPSFHSYLGQMDIKVCLAYANAFLLLSEGYLSALKFKEWYKLTDEEELQEYLTWVSSVVNDSKRVIDRNILNLSVFKPELELPHNEDSEISIEQAMHAFQRVESVGIDQLSCLLSMFMFYEKEDMLQSNGLVEGWKKAKALSSSSSNLVTSAGTSSTPSSPSSSFKKRPFSFGYYFDSLEDYLNIYKNFLNRRSYESLVDALLAKLLVLYFALLQDLYWQGDSFDPNHPMLKALIEDSQVVKQRTEALRSSVREGSQKGKKGTASTALTSNEIAPDLIESSLRLLNQLPVLLTEPLGSPTLYDTVLDLVNFGTSTHSVEFCNSLAGALEVIFSLRGISKYFSPHQQQAKAQAKGSVTPAKPSGASPATNVAGSNSEPKKRGSIFSYFQTTHNAAPAAPSTPDAPRAPAVQSPANSSEKRRASSEHDAEVMALELAQLEIEKQQSLIDCFEIFFQELETYTPTTEAQFSHSEKKVKSLAFVNPIVRVFHSFRSKFSLTQDLLLSAVPTKLRDSIAQHKEASGSSLGGTSVKRISSTFTISKFLTFNFLRSSSLSNADTIKKTTSMYSLDDEDGEVLTASNDRSQRSAASMSSNRAAGTTKGLALTDIPYYAPIEGEPFMIFTFYDLKLYNLFYVDVFGQPKPYIVFRYGDFATKTRSKEIHKELETCWSDDTPVQLPIYEVTTSSIEIVIEVYYESYLTQHCIGQIPISFSPFDLPSYRAKLFDLEINVQSNKVKQAYIKMKNEGRDLPILSLSTNVSRCKRHEGAST